MVCMKCNGVINLDEVNILTVVILLVANSFLVGALSKVAII